MSINFTKKLDFNDNLSYIYMTLSLFLFSTFACKKTLYSDLRPNLSY